VKPTLRGKLERMVERAEEVERLLGTPEVATDGDQLRALTQEHAALAPLVAGWRAWRRAGDDAAAAAELQRDSDPGLRALAADELAAAEARLLAEEQALLRHLVPKDPNDERDLFLEVRAAAGGDEAALFAGELFRMYARYAERRGYSVELLTESEGEHGGYKQVVARIAGRGAYSRLKFESGTHRVQRVPATEASGRIHTSTVTVAILPEVDEVTEVAIDPAALRVDTYRASGAGGQHVNKTDSAVRITHLPTGIVVECQDERSQHKNRVRAMALLAAKLLDAERSKRSAATSAARRLQVGTGDRSERIRTYNFPQARVTDHRIELTLHRLPAIVDGDLDELLDALAHEAEAEALAEIG
jgi:peptide chain release factor 1